MPVKKKKPISHYAGIMAQQGAQPKSTATREQINRMADTITALNRKNGVTAAPATVTPANQPNTGSLTGGQSRNFIPYHTIPGGGASGAFGGTSRSDPTKGKTGLDLWAYGVENDILSLLESIGIRKIVKVEEKAESGGVNSSIETAVRKTLGVPEKDNDNYMASMLSEYVKTEPYQQAVKKRQAVKDKAAAMVEKYAQSGFVPSQVVQFGAGLESGLKGSIASMAGTYGVNTEVYGINTVVDKGVLEAANEVASADDTGFQRVSGDILNSVGNMLPSVMIGILTGSNAVGAVMMGLQSAEQTYNRTRIEGKSHDEAKSYGILVGASEAAFQYILGGIPGVSSGLVGKITSKPLQFILKYADDVLKLSAKNPAWQAVVKAMGKATGRMAGEALEEGLQEYIDAALRYTFFDEKSEGGIFGIGVKGMGLFGRAGYSAFIGALTAGLLGGASVVSDYRVAEAEATIKQEKTKANDIWRDSIADAKRAQIEQESATPESEDDIQDVAEEAIIEKADEIVDRITLEGTEKLIQKWEQGTYEGVDSENAQQKLEGLYQQRAELQQKLQEGKRVKGKLATVEGQITDAQTMLEAMNRHPAGLVAELQRNIADLEARAEQSYQDHYDQYPYRVDNPYGIEGVRSELETQKKILKLLKRRISLNKKIKVAEDIAKAKADLEAGNITEAEYANIMRTANNVDVEKARAEIEGITKAIYEALNGSKIDFAPRGEITPTTQETATGEATAEAPVQNEAVQETAAKEVAPETVEEVPAETAKTPAEPITTEQENEIIRIAKKHFGVTVEFVDSLNGNRGSVNGLNVTLARDTNADADAFMYTLGCEVTHTLEGTPQYAKLKAALRTMIGSKEFARQANERMDSQEGMTLEQAEAEIVTQIAGERLFNPETISRIQNRGLITKIIHTLQNLKSKLFGTKEAQQITRAIELYQKALKKQSPTKTTLYETGLEELNRRANEPGTSIKKPGENPARDVQVPENTKDGRRVPNLARTMVEAGSLTDESVDEIAHNLANDKISYKVEHNPDAILKGDKMYGDLSRENAYRRGRSLLNSCKLPSPAQAVFLQRVLQQLADEVATNPSGTNRVDFMEFATDLMALSTKAGQYAQAQSILKKLTNAGRAMVYMKLVEQLNNDSVYQNKISKGKMPEVTIDQALIDKLLAAKGEDIVKVEDEVAQHIADQVPATFMEKLNAFRYLCMLGSLKTQGRNIFGNVSMLGMVAAKNAIQKTIQDIAVKTPGHKTMTWKFSKELFGFAINDFRAHKKAALGESKYNDVNPMFDILSKRQIMWKPVDKAYKFVQFGMEYFDERFAEIHYSTTLESYLGSHKLTPQMIKDAAANMERYDADTAEGKKARAIMQTLNAGRSIAIKQAQKATFRNESRVANWMATGSRIRGLNVVINGLFPFRKTPINIIARGVEYSPLGLLTNTVRVAFGSVQRGSMDFTEALDRTCSGLSGSAIAIFGAYMMAKGLIKLGDDDELKKVAKAKKQMGEQKYTVMIKGKDGEYVRVDMGWLSPVCMPFFLGAEIYRGFTSGNSISAAEIAEAITNIPQPVFDLSLLQGINKALGDIRYEDEGKELQTVLLGAATNLVNQFIPTFLGQVARTYDGTQRTVYTTKDGWKGKWLTENMQRQIQEIQMKIPGLSKWMEPNLDIWGREQVTDGYLYRGFQNLVSPANIYIPKDDKVTQTLIDLTTKVRGVANEYPMPQQVSQDTMDKYHLTPEEMTKLKRAVGTAQYKAAEDFITNGIKLEYDKVKKTNKSGRGDSKGFVSMGDFYNNSNGLYTNDELRAKAAKSVMEKAYKQAFDDMLASIQATRKR
jgi:hypothetical protein